jgi:hypothetical protein
MSFPLAIVAGAFHFTLVFDRINLNGSSTVPSHR